jgi:hypothetical protein
MAMKEIAALAALVTFSIAGVATTATTSASSGTYRCARPSAADADGQRTPVAASEGAQGGSDRMWAMAQSNNFVVRLTLNAPDNDNDFTGTADFAGGAGGGGSVTGHLDGRDVVFDIVWDPRHTGRYTGHQESADQWSGESVDADQPSGRAHWWAHRA